MLSQQRYDSIKSILSARNIALSVTAIELYADMFEIIAFFTHHKLTNEEMVDAFDFLSDLILGRRPQYAIEVKKEKRIKIQLFMMERLTQTAGKLSLEEKQKFAFCVYYATCIRIYNEEKDEVNTGLLHFTSVERIEHLLSEEMQLRPEFFRPEKQLPVPDFDKDGRSIDNPIQMPSVPESYSYLRRLVAAGKIIAFNRTGSCDGANGHIIDCYQVKVPPKSSAPDNKTQFCLYIDPYANDPGE